MREMNLAKAEAIYRNPKGYSKEELAECLRILNAQPRRLTLAQQIVIADAKARRDILEGVIDAEYRVLPDKLLGGQRLNKGGIK